MTGTVKSALVGELAREHRQAAAEDASVLSLGERLARTLTVRCHGQGRAFVPAAELRKVLAGAPEDSVVELERRSTSYIAPVRSIAVEAVVDLLEGLCEAEGGLVDRDVARERERRQQAVREALEADPRASVAEVVEVLLARGVLASKGSIQRDVREVRGG